MRKAALVVLPVMFAVAADVQAICIAQPSYIVDLEIVSCESVRDYGSRVSECPGVDLPWIRRMQMRYAQQWSGLVVTARVKSSQKVTWWPPERQIDPRVDRSDLERYYLSGAEPITCSDLTPGRRIELYEVQPCCDVIPPDDAPCWFDIKELKAVPDEIKAAR